ncbi:MAG: hypothetical protein H8E44_40535 [Planctomycetes bacterium]|nr:hypothetical protein [Planctomycetota bacterium]
MQVALISLASLFFSTAGSTEQSDAVYKIDFGPPERVAEGYTSLPVVGGDTRFLWMGTELGVRDRGGDDKLNGDFVFGREGEFLLGLDNGDYEVEITCGDLGYAQGPFNVLTQGQPVVEGLRTPKGQFVTRQFAVAVRDECISLKFIAAEDAPFFAVTSMIVRGKKQQRDHRVWPDAPAESIPTLAELEAVGDCDPRRTLQLYCDWLVENRRKDGFFCRNSAEWYRSSYPIRTLLAGYDIFGRKAYLDAATVCLDKLVTEQLPNAAWSSGFRNKPVAERTEAEIHKAVTGTTNTADVGCISTCLAVAYPYVDDARKKTYRNALKRYAEEYAAQWQLPSGGFTNGRWAGRDMTTPYSVATGTQGMSFCSLYAITGDRKYLEIAERATNFLLDNWQEDGRPIHHHHSEDTTQVLDLTEAEDQGNLFYYHEAILWVWHWTKDEALKEKIRTVYTWHIKGTEGLLRNRENGVWWSLGRAWGNAKTGAMPLVLIEYDRSMCDAPDVREAVRRCTVFLTHPDFAKRIGVMCEPSMPWGLHSMQATGFAGLLLAELVKPGVTFLTQYRAAIR